VSHDGESLIAPLDWTELDDDQESKLRLPLPAASFFRASKVERSTKPVRAVYEVGWSAARDPRHVRCVATM
jgi:hypothetical protein